MVSYKNRYGDLFEFKLLENGNIKWTGNFEYSRFGMPNDYSKAWEVFQKEYGGLNYEEFKESVHSYDEETNSYVFKDLLPLITSKKDVINMVDPSGGPYISEGFDMGYFDKSFKGKIVQEFLSKVDGYEIVTKLIKL